MVELFGRSWTRRDIALRTGDLAQIAGITLSTLADGSARGVRVLEARTGAGLTFRIAVDRGFDLLSAEYRGVPLGWHSAAGPRSPALHNDSEDRFFGFLRSFCGLMATCGLDHTLGPEEADGSHFIYPRRDRVDHPLHGRVAMIPARLKGYGVEWRGDDAVIWAEGEVHQVALYGENLVLERRIEADLGGLAIRISDRVTNRGFRPTPHMLLYHFNFGFPLLDAGSEVIAPVKSIVHRTHDARAQGIGWRIQGEPGLDFVEQVYEHALVSDPDGTVPCAIIAPGGAAPLGVMLEYNRNQLPCLVQWQSFQAGIYAVGIEPSTNHVPGHGFAAERNEIITLEHGESRDYATRLTVLGDRAQIDSARRRILAVHEPADAFAPATEDWEDLSAWAAGGALKG